MDIFVLPTLREGLSNSLLEAMAAGVPVIATNIEENKEIIKNKKDGILVQPKDISAISRAIIKLLKNKNLAKNAIKKIRSKYNIKNMINQLDNIYLKI